MRRRCSKSSPASTDSSAIVRLLFFDFGVSVRPRTYVSRISSRAPSGSARKTCRHRRPRISPREGPKRRTLEPMALVSVTAAGVSFLDLGADSTAHPQSALSLPRTSGSKSPPRQCRRSRGARFRPCAGSAHTQCTSQNHPLKASPPNCGGGSVVSPVAGYAGSMDELWARSRSGSHAGRGFHYQDTRRAPGR
jgi:hypothetical protein